MPIPITLRGHEEWGANPTPRPWNTAPLVAQIPGKNRDKSVLTDDLVEARSVASWASSGGVRPFSLSYFHYLVCLL